MPDRICRQRFVSRGVLLFDREIAAACLFRTGALLLHAEKARGDCFLHRLRAIPITRVPDATLAALDRNGQGVASAAGSIHIRHVDLHDVIALDAHLGAVDELDNIGLAGELRRCVRMARRYRDIPGQGRDRCALAAAHGSG